MQLHKRCTQFIDQERAKVRLAEGNVCSSEDRQGAECVEEELRSEHVVVKHTAVEEVPDKVAHGERVH